MLYAINNEKLNEIKEVPFKLERNLQTLVEKNLDKLFSLKFLATEFALENFRFDSVAYSEEDNSFVIIEYKKVSNDSLVDQGYAYLNTILKNKAEIVLLFNKIKNTNKQKEDFDWESLRIYFVSPKFTEYQKSATGFLKMPFKLFEVAKYENGLFSINEINNNKIKDETNTVRINESDKVESEIIVYTEEDHLKKMNETLREIYTNLKEKVVNAFDIDIEAKKHYIAFKHNNKSVFAIEPFPGTRVWKVFLNIELGKIDDPYKKAAEILVGHHGGNQKYVFELKKEDDIDYLMLLIKQAYKE